jgi:hypothetical protein
VQVELGLVRKESAQVELGLVPWSSSGGGSVDLGALVGIYICHIPALLCCWWCCPCTFASS